MYQCSILLILAFIITACSTEKAKFQKYIEQGKCEEAALNIPGLKMQKIKSATTGIGQEGASYALTGMAYGVDFIYLVSAGVVLPLVSCMPALIADGPILSPIPLGGDGEAQHYTSCVDKISDITYKKDQFGNPVISFGENVFKKTANWRCPDLNFAIKNITKIASCYKEQGEKDKAIAQLKNVLKPESFGGCISAENEVIIRKNIKEFESSDS